jgi:hypothetical protein
MEFTPGAVPQPLKKETCPKPSIGVFNPSRRQSVCRKKLFFHYISVTISGTRRSMISLERYDLNPTADLLDRFRPAVSDL